MNAGVDREMEDYTVRDESNEKSQRGKKYYKLYKNHNRLILIH